MEPNRLLFQISISINQLLILIQPVIMAKIKFSAMLDDARGKMGNIVFAKNRGGNYTRNRVVPFNPQTAAQQTNRALLGTVSAQWGLLTDIQRQAWELAVPDWAETNIFGDRHAPTGKNLFVAINKNLLSVGYPSTEESPVKGSPQYMGLFMAAYNIVAGTFKVQVTTAPDLGKIVISATKPMTAGTSFAKGKHRRIGVVAAAGLAAFDFYAAYVTKFGAFTDGANIDIQIRQMLPNGQYGVAEYLRASIAG